MICAKAEEEKCIVYEEFGVMLNFFNSPLQSGDLMIYYVSELSGVMKVGEITDISCKCVLLPFHDSYVYIPLIHKL